MIPVRSVGQLVQLGVEVVSGCARLGRGFAVWGGWWRTGIVDGHERAVLLGDCAGDVCVGVVAGYGDVDDDGGDALIADVSVDLIFDIGVAARGWRLACSGCGREAGVVSTVVGGGVVHFHNVSG